MTAREFIQKTTSMPTFCRIQYKDRNGNPYDVLVNMLQILDVSVKEDEVIITQTNSDEIHIPLEKINTTDMPEFLKKKMENGG